MQKSNLMGSMMHHVKLCGLPALLALPVFAAACATDPVDEPEQSSELNHCVSSVTGEVACFATFTEALSAATGGRISDAAADSVEAFADGTLTDRINALWDERGSKDANLDPPTPGSGDIVIGIVNHGANFQGKDWVFKAPSGCVSADPTVLEWAVQNLNTSPYTVSQMNDNISSVRSFAGCRTTLYADWKLNNGNDGAGEGTYTSTGYVGDVMNDQASSISWHR